MFCDCDNRVGHLLGMTQAARSSFVPVYFSDVSAKVDELEIQTIKEDATFSTAKYYSYEI